MTNSVKVAFVQKINENEFETETLWCDIDGDNFIIDNIPMIAKRVSLGDTIKAEYDKEEKRYYFDDFVAISGNTTVRIFFYNDDLIEPTRVWLNNLQCESEVLLTRSIIAINIPKEVDYTPIRFFLEKGEQDGKWVYEESALEHVY